jgi:hypothetical protein
MGTKNTVVADAWVGHPCASTLSEAALYDPAMKDKPARFNLNTRHVRTYTKDSPMPQEEIDLVHNLMQMNADAINKKLKR